jgi:plasmid stabilization system protein ParE
VDFQLRITEIALADFEEIIAYSWTNFPATTQRFGNAILDHLNLLKTHPYVGSPVAERTGIRQLIHTPIVIYYRVHEHPNFVEILHFWHSSRGVPPI